VAVPGFATNIRKGVDVLPNQVVTTDMHLSVETVGTVVEVVGGGEVVQPTTSQLSIDFGARAVSDLPNPNNSGSPLNLALLAPNTTTQGAACWAKAGRSAGRGRE